MKKYIRLVMMVAMVLAFATLPLVAQMTGIKGFAKDQDGKPITDAVVEIVNPDSGRKATAKTNKNGEYTVIGLTPGNYDATLMRNGAKVDAISKIPIGMGDMREVNFDLKKDLVQGGPSEEQLKQQQEV